MTTWRIDLLEGTVLDQFWPSIEEMLDLVPHTWEDYTKDALYTAATLGNIQVWAVGDDAIRMVLFSHIATFPASKVLQIIWGAGQGHVYELAGDIVDYTLDEYAKMARCSRIDVIGRRGWEKVLGKRGFERSSVVLSRKVIHRGKH